MANSEREFAKPMQRLDLILEIHSATNDCCSRHATRKAALLQKKRFGLQDVEVLLTIEELDGVVVKVGISISLVHGPWR